MKRAVRRSNISLGVLTFLAAATAASCAWADNYSVTVSNLMDIGPVATASTGVTTFRVDPQSGQVSVLGGGGRRLANSLSRVTISITCSHGKSADDGYDHDSGSGNDRMECGRDAVRVTIGAIGFPTGRAQPLSRFTVSMSSASLAGQVNVGVFTTFRLNPIGENQTKTFYLGADFPVAGNDSNRASGTGISPYFVYLTDDDNDQLGAALSAGVVNAYRALNMSKTANLEFGRVSKPVQGSGVVTIDPHTGARTFTGGIVGLSGAAFHPAAFDITGEGGQSFSVSVPGNIQLAGPTNLNVQTLTNLPPSPALSGSSGSQGAFTLKVGGSIPVGNGSLVGTYTGNWTVTVNYN